MATPSFSRSAQRRSPREKPDPFRLGWRYVGSGNSNGTKKSVRVPLTAEDLLHPQENDQIPENTTQERDLRYLVPVLGLKTASRLEVLVLRDCLINWGIPGLRNTSPDVSLFEGVRDRNREWRTFRVVREGARPLLAIEIVSPDAYDPKVRNNDVVIKVREYYRAGVPLYVIVDQKEEAEPRQLIGYRRGARRYEQIPLDSNGRLLLAPVQLLLGLRDNRAVCFDAVTGEEIGDLTAQAQARKEAEALLAAAQARIQELEAQVRRGRGKGPNSRKN